jgi:hypothetical protein
MGKRVGFIISGPLSQIQNLREVLEAYADIWHMQTCAWVTDEHQTSGEITDHIMAFAKEIELSHRHNLKLGKRFYHVAGLKLFRDFIYLANAVFRADHVFYRKIGVYNDFPQRKIRRRLSNAIFGFFMSIKPIRKKIHARFIQGMAAPYKKVLNKN